MKVIVNTKFQEEAIESPISRIQKLDSIQRALLAREALMKSLDGDLVFGPAEGRLRSILKYSGKLGLWIGSFLLLIRRCLEVRNYNGEHKTSPKILFVGINALREVELIQGIKANRNITPTFIDQRNIRNFSILPNPDLVRLVRWWFKLIKETSIALKEQVNTFKKLDLLSSFALRVHELAYLIALFEKLREEHPNLRIIFSTADIPSHAACIAGFRAEYHQHGLLAKTLVFPDFASMVALTSFEGRHVVSCIPDLTVKVSTSVHSYRVEPILVITCDYLTRELTHAVELVRLVSLYGFKTVIRPHPHGDKNVLSDLKDEPYVTIDTEGSFEEFLEKWRPSFIASWYSTTLLDGLLRGALPITFSKGKSVTVLPLDEISLAFPEDSSLVLSCFEVPEKREYYQKIFLDKVMQ